MTVDELITRIIAAYPGASLEAMKSYKPVFHARLKHREGEPLAEAATEVMATFRPKYGQPFPIPADFEAVLPSARRDLARAAAVDARRHAEHKQRLMAEWRRSVDTVPEVRRALETIALEVADTAAWRETSKPIALTARQRQLAVQRAISLQRRCEHGPPERLGADAWWDQISAIAARWNVATTRDEWQQGEWRA
jgi:hypothetical protein